MICSDHCGQLPEHCPVSKKHDRVDSVLNSLETILKEAAKMNPFSGKGLKPGDGPSKEERETGFYEVVFHGEGKDGEIIKAKVTGDKDPGYGSTSKMIYESAITLLETKSEGGIYTPGGVMAEKLVQNLIANAGLTFSIIK